MDILETDREELFASLLAEYDVQLANGNFSSIDDLNSTLRPAPLELTERLEQAKKCLRLLDRAWPRDKLTESPMPETIDRFRVIRELGRGGFGIVYLARDDEHDRLVALKVQRPEAVVSPELRRRFLREATAVARLRHPHIAGLHEVGEAGLQLWVANEYCDGSSLAGWLQTQRGQASPRSAAVFMAALADALQYSHQEGVLHRDVKPSNVLLQQTGVGQRATGDDLSNYTPKLIDFGLAKLTEGESHDTQSGALVGTPAYMAPEQASGEVRQIGPATDVYALGVILYELLTGSPVFVGSTKVDTLRKIVADDPISPRKMRPDLPSALEAICLKCLRKSPRERYASAGALAADLRRFIDNKATEAKPPSSIERLVQWTRRQPIPAAAILLTGWIAMLDLSWPQMNFSALYIVPLVLLAWRGNPKSRGRTVGLLLLLTFGIPGLRMLLSSPGPLARLADYRLVNRAFAGVSLVMIWALLRFWTRFQADPSTAARTDPAQATTPPHVGANLSVNFALLGCGALIALVAAADFLVPANYNFAILYFVPVMLCAWTRNPRLVWAICVLTVVLSAAACLWGVRPPHPLPVLVLARGRTVSSLGIIAIAAVLSYWMDEKRQGRAASI